MLNKTFNQINLNNCLGLNEISRLCHAATFDWQEDNGAATGSPAKGTTRTTARTETNWKNIDDSTTAYSSNPIVAGNNSYDKWQFGKFSGTFNQILSGLFAHTSGAFGTGLTLKGPAATSSDGTRPLYTTPAASANANLTVDMTSAIAIGSGVAVFFGATGPEATGKASSMTTNPCYTNYLPTQLQTTGSAAAGDTATATLTLQYQEN
jgi:hypothetical protein